MSPLSCSLRGFVHVQPLQPGLMVHGQTCRRTRVILAPYPLVCPHCASVLQLCSTSALEGSCTAHSGVNLCLAHLANEKMQWQLLVPLTPEGRGKLFFLLTSRSCQALAWDTRVPLLHQEAQPHPFLAGVRQHQMLCVSFWRCKLKKKRSKNTYKWKWVWCSVWVNGEH